MRLPRGALLLIVLACPAAATADPVKLAPIVDARLRWEQVEQDGIVDKAEAVTARIRSGVTATTGPWQVLVNSEATLAIVPDYKSGSNGRTRYPLVRDPQNVELNRARLRYAAHGLTVTAGRQLLELADQRFVGSGSFRQNEQTFDAVRFQLGAPARVFADVTYAWAAHTPNGVNGTGAARYTVAGDDVFARAGAHTPLGTAAAFAYLVDQDEFAVQGYRLSSQTYGARLAGAVRVSPQLSLAYIANAARQSDWHRNPNRYRADYWLIEGAGTYRALTLTAG